MALKLRTLRLTTQQLFIGTQQIFPSSSSDMERLYLSFETGEQGQFKMYFPQYPAIINSFTSQVVKAIAATDNATVTGGNATGASTGGVCTHLAGAAIGDLQTATPTTNNTVATGSYYYFTTAKTTTGGKVIVSVFFTITG